MPVEWGGHWHKRLQVRIPLPKEVLAEFDELNLVGVKITVVQRYQIIGMKFIIILNKDLLQDALPQFGGDSALV